MGILRPTLYGLSTKAKIKVWTITTKHVSATESQVIIQHGEEHGKQQETIRKIKEGKNTGRKNATTIYEQAELEAFSFWKKKQDKGYCTSKAQLTKTNTTRLPMLALKFADRRHDLVWPVFIQPKLNGVRCLIERIDNTIVFHSRGNKQFKTLNHLTTDCLAMMKPGEILDGELYSHGDITFQELVSLIKNEKAPDPDRVRRFVKFWNYDRCANVPFSERAKSLVEYGSIKRVETWPAHNEAEVMNYHQRFLNQGYEGTMVRSGGNDPYLFQYRSASLLKLKDFQDAEATIIGCKDGVGKDEGKATFRCRFESGVEFDVRCKGSDAVRQEQWINRKKYLNKILTVSYQYLSDDGCPIFPVGICIRDYE